ncbi:MAG: ATP-binding protein [Clostridium sp.]|nr:ATP-binding protein [Clostridium sp.]
MKEITLKAIKKNIPVVTDFVNDKLEEEDCPPKAMMQVDIAIDEIFVNIANYAYEGESGNVTVQVDIDDDNGKQMVLTFIDSGIPFNPLEAGDPDITLPAEKRSVGGLGIFIVRKTMDGMKYMRKNNRNILVIRKNLLDDTDKSDKRWKR